MKKTLLTLAMVAVSVAAFAQGKISFATDSLHAVYLSSDTAKLVEGDAAVANMAYNTTVALAGSPTLVAELWAGTSAGSLSFQSAATGWSISKGRWQALSVLMPTIPGAVAAYFQVVIHDSRINDRTSFAGFQAAAEASLNQYYGWSPVFTAVPGTASYANLYQTTTPVFSTWPKGTQVMTGTTGLGAIELIANVPEPSTMALAGLGAAALLIFRRRR